MTWLHQLRENRRTGSFPRCLLFTEGEPATVADRLTRLVDLPQVRVDAKHFWMPRGLPTIEANGKWNVAPIEEAKLGESEFFLSENDRKEVTGWWLAVAGRANTPNWDIASTCTIDGETGLLLVEAKAHERELDSDGKRQREKTSKNSRDNDRQIRNAMAEASTELCKTMAGWCLSCDSHYQLANRFAWAWKIASLGVPVVLVYLGFLGAEEMQHRGEPFIDCADWVRAVLEHSKGVVPGRAWGRELRTSGALIRPLIRACKQELR